MGTLVVFPFSMECGASFRLILFIINIYCIATINGISSNCTTHNVYENELGNITCHFSVDIRLHKQDVQVNVIKVGTFKPTMVVIYSWVNGDKNIAVEKGYECDDNLTDTLTINIPNATQNHSGEYKCIVHGDNHTFTSCFLSVEEKSQDSNDGDHSLDKCKIIGIVLGVVVGVPVVAFIILMIVPKSRKWIRSRIPACCCRNKDPGQADPTDPSQVPLK